MDQPTPEPAIIINGVTQQFGPRVIFQDVSCTIARGEVFVILGGSGCGKSTLLRQIVGLLPPSAGSITVLGHDMYAGRGDVLTRIGVMFQAGALFGSMTLLENVMLPLQVYTDLPEAACARVAQVKLSLVGLGDFGRLMPAEISGGMAKRAAIARALALDPPLLFLDEPSAGLDPITSAGIDQLILDLRRDLGTTFVLVTHELASILAIADRCLMLDRTAKGVIAEGDPRVLRDESTHPTVRAFFRREAEQLPAEPAKAAAA
ncbi:MAG: ATP-binding cassette domain-containing protein [Acetobacteraceae bacterium]|nr:ATP-binding cassette domain-containing protein [Acetobacteraceae bacterium]